MDTRLTELLPAALGIKNGDVKIIKNAGGTITHPFGSAMRSLLVAIYELGVEEVMIIGHTDCGVQHMDSETMLQHMRERGISQDHIEMMQYCDINLNSWLSGFNDTEEAVQKKCTHRTPSPARASRHKSKRVYHEFHNRESHRNRRQIKNKSR